MGALGVQWGPPGCQGKFPGARIGPPGPHFGSGGTPNGVPGGPLGLSGVANAKSETSGWKNRTRGMEEESRARGAAGRGAHPGKLHPQGSLQTRSKCGGQGPPSARKHAGPGHAAKGGAERPTASTGHLGNAWMEKSEEGRGRQVRGKRPRGARSAQGATFVSNGAYRLIANVLVDA